MYVACIATKKKVSKINLFIILNLGVSSETKVELQLLENLREKRSNNETLMDLSDNQS